MCSGIINQPILRLLNVATSGRMLLLASVTWCISSVSEMNGDEMSYIPAGSYLMGTDAHLPDERPAHFVFISGLYCDKYEISLSFWEDVAQWALATWLRFRFQSPNRKKRSFVLSRSQCSIQ